MLQVVFHDVAVLTEKLFPIVEAMQKHFSAGSGAYYSDSIFFLSVAMHRIMPAGEEGVCVFLVNNPDMCSTHIYCVYTYHIASALSKAIE